MSVRARKLEIVVGGDAKGAEEAAADTESAFTGLAGKLKGVGGKIVEGMGFGGGLAIGARLGEELMVGLGSALTADVGQDLVAAQLNLDPQVAADLGRTAGKIYAGAYGESLGEVQQAVGDVQSAIGGMLADSDDALQKSTEKALNLSTAFGVEVAEGAQLAGLAVRHGLADTTDEAFDLIVASLQSMPAQMRGELFPAIEEYGDELATLGITGDRAFGLLATAAKDGMYGIDKTGDAIKEFIIRATDLSASSGAAYERLGLDQAKMTNAILAGGDSAAKAFDEIVSGLLAIEDPGKRAESAIALFGTPIEDLNVTQLPSFLEGLRSADTALGDVTGRAEKMGETLADNTATDLESFKRGIQVGITNAGNKAIEMLVGLPGPAKAAAGALAGVGIVGGPALESIGGMTRGVSDLAAAGRKLNIGTRVADLASKVKGAGSALGSAASSMASLGKETLVTTGRLAAQGAAWVGHKVATAASAAATGLMSGAQWALNTAMAANPIVLVVAALVALAAVFVIAYQKVDWFRAGVDAAFGFVLDVVQGVFGWVRDNWPLLLAIITGPIGLAVLALTRNWDTIREGVSKVKDWVGDKVGSIVGFFTGMPGKIRSVASGMFDGIRDAFKSAVNFIIRGWNRIEFKIPGFSMGPVKFGGFTLGLPDIPQLATGALVTGPTLAVVGEGPEPEVVQPLSHLERMLEPAATGPSLSIDIDARGAVGLNEQQVTGWVASAVQAARDEGYAI